MPYWRRNTKSRDVLKSLYPVQWGISCVFATLSELCWRKEEANLQCLPRERKVVTWHHHFLPAWVEDGGWSLKGGTVTSSMEPDSGQTSLCPPLLRRTVCQCSASRDLWNSLRGRCLTIRAWATNVSFVTLMFSPGGQHGNPLQYSCLGNPMDRGAWWAIVHGVTKVLDTS